MPLPNLTPATIQYHATESSFARGASYFRSGAVVSLTQRQQTLQAEVEGNEVTPYRVTIDFDGGVSLMQIAPAPTTLKAGVSTSSRPFWPAFTGQKPSSSVRPWPSF